MLTRRQAIGGLGVLGAGAALGTLSWRRQSQAVATPGACPSLGGGRIRWIVPHAAGGGYDADSRLIEPFLERRLHAEIAIENLTGAGGILGARAIQSAPPDGRTVGFLGVSGLLVASLIEVAEAPDPSAFTVLGRVSRSWHVWAARAGSPLRTLDDAQAAARARDLVFAISEVASVNFLSIGVTAGLLGMGVTMVPGFEGSRAAVLAAIRGDVDLVCSDFEALKDAIDAGELHPLLQVSDRPIAPHPALSSVPTLTSRRTGREVTALIELIGAGRVVVAPPGLDTAVARCLGDELYAALASDELRAAARRPLEIGTSAEARADIVAASRDAPILLSHVRTLVAKMRG